MQKPKPHIYIFRCTCRAGAWWGSAGTHVGTYLWAHPGRILGSFPAHVGVISVSFLASLGLVAGLRFGSSRVFPRAHIGQVPGSFCCCLFWAFVLRLASFRVPSTAFPKAALGPISRCALARALCSCRGSFWAHFRSVLRACWANCGILLSS